MAQLNHIGIAVANLEGIKNFLSLLDLAVDRIEPVPDQNVVTHFIPLPVGQSYLELLEPSKNEGPIAQFLNKKGPGIHHLSFTVNKGELVLVCERIKAAGYRLIYDQPKVGAHGMKINFIHPSSTGGILIEVMEPN